MKIRVKPSRIVLLVVVLLVLGLPPVFGMLTESAVRERAESLRDEGRLLVTIESFDRGWFSSRALLTVEPNPAGDRARQALIGFVEPMQVVVDFSHGPLSVRDGLFFGFSKLHARPVADDDGTLAAPFDFDFRAQSTFGGSVNFAGEIMPFDSGGEDFALSFSGARFHGTVAGEHVQAVVDADAVQYTRGVATYSLLGLRTTADTERMSAYVMPGTMTLGIDRFSMDVGRAERSTLFDVRGLAVDSSTALDDARERLSGALRIELERLQLLAGDTEITGGELQAAADRLDVAALDAYSEAAARAAERGTPLADEVEPAVLRLLAEGPSATIDSLRFNVDGESFDANAQAAADPAALPPAGAADIRSAALWTAVLDGRAELTIAKPLAEQIAIAIARSQIGGRIMDGESMPGQSIEALARVQAGIAIGMLSAQGLLEDIGEAYRIALQLEDGRLTINGQTLPFDLL